MRRLVWRCRCGHEIPERCVSANFLATYGEGDWQVARLYDQEGTNAASTHIEEAEQNSNQDHKIAGLFLLDDEEGKERRLITGLHWQMAVSRELIPPISERFYERKERDGGEGGTPPGGKPLLEAEVIPMRVTLPAIVLTYFQEDQALDPETYPDNSPEIIGSWLAECVMQSHAALAIIGALTGAPDQSLMGRLTLIARHLVQQGAAETALAADKDELEAVQTD